MEYFNKWIFQHNNGDKTKYILSLIGVFCYLFLFTVLTNNTSIWAGAWIGIIVIIASYDVGRYCVNRYIYLSGEDIVSEHKSISSVVRFHSFSLDEYFGYMRRKIIISVLWILFYSFIFLGLVILGGENVMPKSAALLIVGVISATMVYAAFFLKKRLFIRELQKGESSGLFVFLKVIGAVFRIFEVIAILAGSAVTTVLLWLLLGSAIEPQIDQTQIVYRSYTNYNSIFILILAFAILAFGLSMYKLKRFRKIMFIFSGICLIFTVVLTYIQCRRYTELSGDKFCVYDFGLVKEYNLQEVKRFKVYADNTDELQFELIFNDGNAYKVLGSVSSCSDTHEKFFYSDYNFVAYYVGELLKQGVNGTLENGDILGENAHRLHENVERGWQDIVKQMDG